MNAIRSYIENVFASLPRTSEVLQAKADMLANMEEKYQELKESGKSENEAVGQVIAEFGNIDELLTELRISPETTTTTPKNVHQVSQQEAEDWIKAKKRSGLLTAIGVFLILFGVASLIYLTTALHSFDWIPVSFNGDVNPAFGITFMFLMIAVAVGLFIYSGVQLEKFAFYKSDFELKGLLKQRIQERKNRFMPYYTVSLVLGVVLCILAPLVIILPVLLIEVSIKVTSFIVLMLLLIGSAVFLFTYFGSVKDAYDRLLKIGEYEWEHNNKSLSAVSSAIWPLAVIAFFIIGFGHGGWVYAWIVFPVTGLLFTAISGIIKAIKESKR